MSTVRSMATTVREMVKEIQREVLAGNLLPLRAAELLTKLTALLSNVSEEVREADLAYSLVLLEHLRAEEKANRARIIAETSPEYQRKREARDRRDLVLELSRALKHYLRMQQEEMRLGSH